MKAINKDILREIVKSKSRFLTLILIVFLGSLTYVGLNSTVYDIKKSVDTTIKKNNMYDIRLDAPAGFTDYDINLLKNFKDVDKIVFYNETIDYDKKILYIESENTKYDMSYLQNKIIKSGINIKKVSFVAPKKDSLKNVAVIYLKNSKKYNTFSKKYLDYVKNVKENLNVLLAKRPLERKEEINKELDEGLNKLNQGLDKLNSKREDLIRNRNKILISEGKLKEEKIKFLNAKQEILNGRAVIKENEEKINEKTATLNGKYAEVLDGLNKINQNLNKMQEGLAKISVEEKKIDENEKKLNDNLGYLSKEKIQEYRKKISDGRAKLNLEKEKINKTLEQKKSLEGIKAQLEKGLAELKNASNTLEDKERNLSNQEKEYNEKYSENLNKFNVSYEKLKEAKIKLVKGHKDISKVKMELQNKKNDLDKKKKYLLKPAYVVGTRYDNNAFLTLYNNIRSTKIMCYLFPACFFVIGLFVTVTTMIRFSTEQRVTIGVYKFLGYKNKYIIKKFLIYGLVPTIIGLFLGSLGGTVVLPKIIAPTLVVDFIPIFKNIKIYFVPTYSIVIAIAFILSITIAILAVVIKQLNEKVVDLLTGRENEKGKRILLEKSILWKKLNFSKKILFRNLLKYKGRMFMTILGIGACTALIYLGISLHYSISDITRYQYNKVKKYDAVVYFQYDAPIEKKEEYFKNISKFSKIFKLYTVPVKYSKDGLDYQLSHEYLISNNDEDFFNFKLNQNESVISIKTSKILHKKKGSNITVYDIYNRPNKINVDGVFKNYIYQYIYTKDTTKEPNAVLVKFNNKTKDIEKLLDNEIVYSINTKEDTKEFFEKQIKSLSNVVVLMIILGASLSFIVTYNLGNINIIERKRELSTLKVLGYRKSEMYLYIFREIFILAIIATLFGLYIGRKLHLFLALMFKTSPIQPVVALNYKPFLFSFVLSMFFVVLVCSLLIQKINKINMIEALKASE